MPYWHNQETTDPCKMRQNKRHNVSEISVSCGMNKKRGWLGKGMKDYEGRRKIRKKGPHWRTNFAQGLAS
eukprot:15886429-Heterocapsa_arctica.AAC.1